MPRSGRTARVSDPLVGIARRLELRTTLASTAPEGVRHAGQQGIAHRALLFWIFRHSLGASPVVSVTVVSRVVLPLVVLPLVVLLVISVLGYSSMVSCVASRTVVAPPD